MFLKERESNHLVEILNLNDLFDLYATEVEGRYHWGEEAQEPERFRKTDLIFLSGEALPRCWVDPHYRDEEFATKF